MDPNTDTSTSSQPSGTAPTNQSSTENKDPVDELTDEFTKTPHGLLIGPIPKDEQDRKRLLRLIEETTDAGQDFCPSYLMEYIYTDD
jgi:hypothetical protein